MNDTQLKQMLSDLENNWIIAGNAFGNCNPQNIREYQVCETLRTMNLMLRDIVTHLIEQNNPPNAKDQTAGASAPGQA